HSTEQACDVSPRTIAIIENPARINGQGRSNVVMIKLTRTQTLRNRRTISGSQLGNGIQANVAFEGGCHPPTYSSFFSNTDPFLRSLNSSHQGRFQNNILRLHFIQKLFFFLAAENPYHFLVHSNGNRTVFGQIAHCLPLSLSNGLHNAVYFQCSRPTK